MGGLLQCLIQCKLSSLGSHFHRSFATQRPPSLASSWSPGPQRFLCHMVWCLQVVREVCRLQHGPGRDQHCCITKPWTNRVIIVISVSTSQPIGHSGDRGGSRTRALTLPVRSCWEVYPCSSVHCSLPFQTFSATSLVR